MGPWERSPTRSPDTVYRAPILWLMIASIVAIGTLSYLDSERESQAALSDFAQEQTLLRIGSPC